jgi:hypothetical protein
MSVRHTSKDAYQKLVVEKKLPEKQRLIYALLYEFGPASAAQVWTEGARHGVKGSPTQSNIHARLNELRKKGLVYEVKTAKCPITGNSVIIWDATDRVDPKRLSRRKDHKTRAEEFKKLLQKVAGYLVRDEMKNPPLVGERILQRIAEIEGPKEEVKDGNEGQEEKQTGSHQEREST